MKSTLRDRFEFKTRYCFFWHLQLQYVKKLVEFYSNSLHCKFEFFTKHLTLRDFLFFYLCCVYSNLQRSLRLGEKAKTEIKISLNAF